MSDITIGYWKIRGLAAPIRSLLHYAGQEFEDVQFEQGDAPDYSGQAWFKVKATFPFELRNLPYLIDGEVKITQTNAILRYLGEKFDLLGSSKVEKATCDMMLEYAMDLRNAVVKMVYNPDYENLLEKHVVHQKSRLQDFNDYLEGKDWFAGGKNPTICDFHLYEMFDQHKIMKPGFLEQFPNLVKFNERFEALPKIAEYLKSDKFYARPINGKQAAFK